MFFRQSFDLRDVHDFAICLGLVLLVSSLHCFPHSAGSITFRGAHGYHIPVQSANATRCSERHRTYALVTLSAIYYAGPERERKVLSTSVKRGPLCWKDKYRTVWNGGFYWPMQEAIIIYPLQWAWNLDPCKALEGMPARLFLIATYTDRLMSPLLWVCAKMLMDESTRCLTYMRITSTAGPDNEMPSNLTSRKPKWA